MTPLHIFARKKREQTPLTMVALSDAPSAQIAGDAGIDAILVGDSLGNTALGYNSTLPVTMDAMAHHVGAVVRGARSSSRPDVAIIADMPFGSYASAEKGVENAVRLMQLGAHAVKIEGTQAMQAQDTGEIFSLLRRAGIPVMGHIGFTPQSSLKFESIVQGRTASDAQELLRSAQSLEQAACFALVLEAMTGEVAREISRRLEIPTIGIGAGAACDGQVLVWHDLVGITAKPFKMARAFAQTREIWTHALQNYVAEVEGRHFPLPENGWTMAPEASQEWEELRLGKPSHEFPEEFDDSDPFEDDPPRPTKPLDEQPF